MTLNSIRRATAMSALAAALLASGSSRAATDAPGDAPHYTRVASLFGESDEEKAARLAAQQHEQAQDAAISTLTNQVSQLQAALRDITGQIEEARHQNTLLKEQISKMQKDFQYRLCQLSAQTLGAGSDGAPVMDCSAFGGSPAAGGQGAAAPSAGAQMMSSGQSAPLGGGAADNSGGMQMGQPSGNLGWLPAGTSMPTPRNGQDVTIDMGSAAAKPAAASANAGQYKAAMDLLAKGRYSEASAAFQAFADANPNAAEAPQAVYWVGSVAFVQKDYANAARAFADQIKKYPQAQTAPQSMLRLGQSLIAMNQKKEGCSALAALRVQYPHASASIRDEATNARKAAGCH